MFCKNNVTDLHWTACDQFGISEFTLSICDYCPFWTLIDRSAKIDPEQIQAALFMSSWRSRWVHSPATKRTFSLNTFRFRSDLKTFGQSKQNDQSVRSDLKFFNLWNYWRFYRLAASASLSRWFKILKINAKWECYKSNWMFELQDCLNLVPRV